MELIDSKIEWIGQIPSDWRLYSLSQIVEQVKNKNKDLQENNLLSLSYGKIKRKDIDSSDGLLPASFDGYNIIEEGDIVLRLTDLQNDHTSLRVGRTAEKGIITSAYCTIRPREKAYSKFLYYLLHSFDIKKGFYGMGSGVRQGLNYDEVRQLRVALPSVSVANRVVEYLDETCEKLDAIIAESKESICEYERLIKAAISEKVTRGFNSEVKNRQFRTAFVGEIQLPDNYQIIAFRHMISVLTDYTANGSFGDLAKNVQYSDRPDYARLVRLTDLRVNFENDGVYVNEAAYNYLGKSSLHGGEILLANVGAHAGFAIEMPVVDFKATLGPNMFLIKTDESVLNPRFAVYALTGDFCKNQLDILANNTTAQPKLNKDNVRGVLMVVPPIDEQKQIADYLDEHTGKYQDLIREKEQLIEDLEEYKRSIIYEVITGKKEVS